MPLSTRVGGIWRTPFGVSTKVNGSWRGVQNIFVKMNGAWRTVWSAILQCTRGAMYGSASYVTKNADHVECYAYNPNGTGGEAGVVTNFPIDLTNASTVGIDWSIEGQSSIRSDGIFIVSSNKTGGGGVYNARYYTGSNITRQVTTLSVSSLSGSFYIRGHASVNGDINYWKRIRVYRLLVDNTEIWNASNNNSFV